MYYALHSRFLQSPEASIKSRGSRSKPLPHPPPLRGRLHHLLLQIGGARSGRLNCSFACALSLSKGTSRALRQAQRTFVTTGPG